MNILSRLTQQKPLFGMDEQTPVLLFSGRLSHEKGIMEIPEVFEQAKTEIPNLKMVFAGTGPAEDEIKKAMPDAVFLGWVDHSQLAAVYSSADLLILPSKFDTFSCSVLESFSCGLPVLAYRSKGPKDIIQHQLNGFLANNKAEMGQFVIEYFKFPAMQKQFRVEAVKRASDYSSQKIMKQFLTQTGL
jgi:glycosyltransferase involved in cell wall biosynthesis